MPSSSTTDHPVSLAVAGELIDALAARDFPTLTAMLADDVSFRALLPRRVLELTGVAAVESTFATWFGDAERWELVEAVVGEVGGRVHLRWRIQCTKPALGPGTFVVEQQIYADPAADGRLADVALLCTGFRPRAVSTTVWGGWGADVRDDPFPTFAEARGRCPVQPARLADGHDAWLVLGYEAARQALGDPRLSKDMLAALDRQPDVVAEGLPGPDFAHHMLATDGSDHRRLRNLVAGVFRPSRVAAMRPTIEGLTDVLLDRLAAAGPDAVVDLRAGLAHPLPFAVICELLGVADDHRPTLEDAFARLLQPWPSPPPPDAVAASDVVTGTLRALVAETAPDPDGDIVAVLVDAVARGGATEAEALSSLFQLMVAGHDTTSSLIGNGVVALLDDPEQLRALQRRPDLLPGAVEELLRFTAPVPHATFRLTNEAVTLAGATIPAGAQVLIGLGAANRDPMLVGEPEVLDVTRPPARHLAFGHGAHHCLGAALARLEAEVAFRRLVDRFPDLRLAVPRDELAWSHGDGLVLRGLAALPVILGPDHRPPPPLPTPHPQEQP